LYSKHSESKFRKIVEKMMEWLKGHGSSTEGESEGEEEKDENEGEEPKED